LIRVLRLNIAQLISRLFQKSGSIAPESIDSEEMEIIAPPLPRILPPQMQQLSIGYLKGLELYSQHTSENSLCNGNECFAAYRLLLRYDDGSLR